MSWCEERAFFLVVTQRREGECFLISYQRGYARMMRERETTLQVVNLLTSVTQCQIPYNILYGLLKDHVLHEELRLELKQNCRYRRKEFMGALAYSSLTRSSLEMRCDWLRRLGC